VFIRTPLRVQIITDAFLIDAWGMCTRAFQSDVRGTPVFVLAHTGPGERYHHFAEIVGALGAQIFRSELIRMRVQWISEVSWVGSLEIGVGARVQGAVVNKFCQKSVATLWGGY
jgi:hypothetical protein